MATETSTLLVPDAQTRKRAMRPVGSQRPARSGRLAMHLALIIYCTTSAAAFVWTAMISLKTNPEFFTTAPWSLPAEPQFQNYVTAWSGAQIGRFFLNSLYATVVSVTVSLIFAAMAAYVLATVKFVGRGVARLVFLAGLMMPPFLVIIPLYALLQNLGLLGSIHGLVLVYIATQIPFSVYLLSSFFQSLPRDFEEAAAIDGAGPFRTFFSVVLPQTMPALASVALLNTLSIWNEFFFALVLLNDVNSQTIPIGILGLAINAQYSAQWVQLFAGLIITMIPVLILFSIAQEKIAQGVNIGGIKG